MKPANFECEWTIEDDSRLLKGIYQHGMGAWEAIKMDDNLKLGDKILINDSKTEIKRVHTRGEYLLKILKKQIDQKLGVVRYFLAIMYAMLYSTLIFISSQNNFYQNCSLDLPSQVNL